MVAGLPSSIYLVSVVLFKLFLLSISKNHHRACQGTAVRI